MARGVTLSRKFSVAQHVKPSAVRLAQFFTNEVDGVPPPSLSLSIGTQLTSFEDVTAEEVRKFILVSPIKTCVLDPLTTSSRSFS